MSVVLVSREEHELMHYRTPGSKNGIRRYQYADGSLTPEGREHYGVGEGHRNRAYIDAETSEQRMRRETDMERAASRIEKYQAKVARYDTRAERYERRAAKSDRLAKRMQKNAERSAVTKAFLKKQGLSELNEGYMNSDAFLAIARQNQETKRLTYKSQQFRKKAERGKKKLEQYRAALESYLPEDIKDEVKHSGLSDDFFKMLEEMSEEQRNVIYALFDDILPDEDEEIVAHAEDFLMHYRTKGSKNGQRLYQYEDGSLTPLGREHYGVGQGRDKDKQTPPSDKEIESKIKDKIDQFNKNRQEKKAARDAAAEEKRKQQEAEIAKRNEERKEARNLSDDDLNKRIDRLQREKRYSDLLNERDARAKGPLRAKAEQLLTDAAENLARQSLNLAVDKIVGKAKDNLSNKFKLSEYKNVDPYNLDSEKLAAVSTAFNQAAQIVRNKYAVEHEGRNPNEGNNNQNNQQQNQNKQEQKAENKPESKPEPKKESLSQNQQQGNEISRNQRRKMRSMASSGKSAAEIAKQMGVSVSTVEKYAGEQLKKENEKEAG